MKQKINKFIYNHPVCNAIIRELTGKVVVKVKETIAEMEGGSFIKNNKMVASFNLKKITKYKWYKDKRDNDN